PAAVTASISDPKAAKSADRIEGGMATGCCGMGSPFPGRVPAGARGAARLRDGYTIARSGAGTRRGFPALAAERMRREGTERLELLGEEAELLQRELQGALRRMALDLGLELRLRGMRARE